MLKLFRKFVPALIFWGIFVYIILQVPYPKTITQASIYQLLSFFITLFIALVFTLNIFLNFILLSVSFALGIIFLLILKSLDSLNLVTTILTILAVALLFSYFRKTKKSSLTLSSKIPKLNYLRRKK